MKPKKYNKFQLWRLAKVRAIGWRGNYVLFTPNWGVGIPWLRNKKTSRKRLIRAGRLHGLQLIEWHGARWVVHHQVLGHSRVRGESFMPSVPGSRRTRRRR